MLNLSITNGEIEIRSDFPERDKDRIKAVPGAHYPPDRHRWLVPLTWASCITLRGIFGDELVLGDDVVAWATNERVTRIDPAMELRAAWDAAGDPDLYPFQRAGVQFLAYARRALLCDPMGTGKTPQTIRTLAELVRRGENPFPALVICPNSMVRTWRRELVRWFPGLDVGVVKGSAAQRREIIEQTHHVYVVNWEAVRNHSRLKHYPGGPRLKRCIVCEPSLADVPANSQARCEWCPKEFNKKAWATVIADEIHRMKDPKSKQTQATWSLVTPDTRFVYGLTGTPIADAPQDMWPALHLISRDEFPSRTRYVERYCQTVFNVFGGLQIIGLNHDHKEEFFSVVDPRMRRMPKDAVLPFLPRKTYSERIVEMSTKQARAYKQMKDGMMSLLGDDGNGGVLVAVNPLVQLGRMSQFASSYAEIGVDEISGKESVTLAAPSNKVEALLEILEETSQDDHIVVFAASRQLIQLAGAKLKEKGIAHDYIIGGQTDEERDHAMTEFQAGRLKAILCTIQAGGVGITLTRANTAVFLQRSWSNVDNMQAEDRVHRIGSEIHDRITIVDVISAGTLEEAQREVLAGKGERLEEVMRDRQTLARLLEGGAF